MLQIDLEKGEGLTWADAACGLNSCAPKHRKEVTDQMRRL